MKGNKRFVIVLFLAMKIARGFAIVETYLSGKILCTGIFLFSRQFRRPRDPQLYTNVDRLDVVLKLFGKISRYKWTKCAVGWALRYRCLLCFQRLIVAIWRKKFLVVWCFSRRACVLSSFLFVWGSLIVWNAMWVRLILRSVWCRWWWEWRGLSKEGKMFRRVEFLTYWFN